MADKRASNPTWIYFILHGEDVWGENIGWDGLSFVKIGRAVENCRNRMSHIQCGNPVSLKFLGCMPGDSKLEHELHKYLKPFRHGCGEWFNYMFPVANFINSLHLFNIDGNCEPKGDVLLGCNCEGDLEELMNMQIES
jgi:hypothetical protein